MRRRVIEYSDRTGDLFCCASGFCAGFVFDRIPSLMLSDLRHSKGAEQGLHLNGPKFFALPELDRKDQLLLLPIF